MKKELYLAGGPFCGLQEVFSRIYGVLHVTAGYANSTKDAPTEEELASGAAGAAECIKIEYNPNRIDISALLGVFFAIVNPYTDGIQGKCKGPQYRSGVYYTSREDVMQISYYMNFIQNRGINPQMTDSTLVVNEFEGEQRERPKLRTEMKELANFIPAPEEKQNLLRKDPAAYTPIDIPLLEKLGVFENHF